MSKHIDPTQHSVQNTIKEMDKMEEQAIKKKRSRTPLIVGGLIVLLTGAAFVAGQLLSGGRLIAMESGGVVEFTGPDGGINREVRIQLEPSDELPQSPPEVVGIFTRREDNSIFVSAGDGRISVIVENDNVVVQNAGGSGNEVEVVITAETEIYKDVTQSSFDGVPTSGTVEQKVEAGMADEIGQNSFVSAWGERRGDRIIASVLVYSEPIVFRRGP